jgi:hypothetical protein
MVFTAITPGPDLTSAQRRRAAAAGPAHVLVRTSYSSLLGSAGFVDVVGEDVTAAYRSTLGRWIDETERRRDDVLAALAEAGEEQYEERQSHRRAAMAAIDAGVLQRWVYVARRPSPRRGRRVREDDP